MIVFAPAVFILLYYRAYKDEDYREYVYKAFKEKKYLTAFEDKYVIDFKNMNLSEITKHTTCLFWLTILFIYRVLF